MDLEDVSEVATGQEALTSSALLVWVTFSMFSNVGCCVLERDIKIREGRGQHQQAWCQLMDLANASEVRAGQEASASSTLLVWVCFKMFSNVGCCVLERNSRVRKHHFIDSMQ